MRGLLLLLAAWAGAAAVARPDASIELRWRYKDLPEGMEIRELKAQAEPPLWEMGVADSLEQAPAGPAIAGQVLKIRPGSERLFLLVFSNKTKKDLHFFAAPHQSAPAEHSLGTQFWCLCLDHVYTVPAGKIWWRVVKLAVRPSFEGKPLSITHDLVGRDRPDDW